VFSARGLLGLCDRARDSESLKLLDVLLVCSRSLKYRRHFGGVPSLQERPVTAPLNRNVAGSILTH